FDRQIPQRRRLQEKRPRHAHGQLPERPRPQNPRRHGHDRRRNESNPRPNRFGLAWHAQIDRSAHRLPNKSYASRRTVGQPEDQSLSGAPRKARRRKRREIRSKLSHDGTKPLASDRAGSLLI